MALSLHAAYMIFNVCRGVLFHDICCVFNMVDQAYTGTRSHISTNFLRAEPKVVSTTALLAIPLELPKEQMPLVVRVVGRTP
jgi:hypothetical protein